MAPTTPSKKPLSSPTRSKQGGASFALMPQGSPGRGPAGSPTLQTRLKVVCRLRPLSEQEKRAGQVPTVTASDERSEVSVTRPQPGTGAQVRSTHRFDRVLTPFSTQSDAFTATVRPLIQDALSGYDVVTFAYGQTGTGKTYTMEGELDSDGEKGLVPRTAAGVMQAISAGPYVSSQIGISCLEIYNEELTDLLAPAGCSASPAGSPRANKAIPQASAGPRVDIKESGNGVVCQGLSEVVVATMEDVYNIVRKVQERRHVAETRVHARSSRSHCVFTLRVCCRKQVPGGELQSTGRIHLVDLAGSESAKQAAIYDPTKPGAGLEGDRERRNINQSLLTLGRVILALRDDAARVPYRDSKLTRLLQDALGGACCTVMIATIAPTQAALEETLSTLAYAEKAMGIQMRPVADSVVVPALAAPCATPAKSPRAGGAVPGFGTPVLAEGASADAVQLQAKYSHLEHDLQEAAVALANKNSENLDLEKRLQEAERRLEDQRKLLEEKDYVLSKTIEFADLRANEADALAQALGSTRARNATFAENITARSTAAHAAKAQVRAVVKSAEDRVPRLTQEATQSAAAAAGAAEDACNGRARAHEAMEAAVTENHRILGGLVNSVREASANLSRTVGAASAEASQAGTKERASTSERLTAIGGAARAALAAATEGQEKVTESVAQGEKAILAQTDSLQEQLRTGSKDSTAAARALVTELRQAHAAAAGAHEDACTTFGETVRGPIGELGAKLRAAALEAERHTSMAAHLKSRCMAEFGASHARRGKLGEAFAGANQEHEAAAAADFAGIAETLKTAGAEVSVQAAAADAKIESVSQKVEGVCESVEASSRAGERLVSAALGEAEKALSGAFEASRDGLARVLDGLKKTQKTSAKGGVTSLADTMLSVVAALDQVRDAMSKDIAALREQRGAEEQLLATVQRQREDLEEDLARSRSSLASAQGELQAAGSSLAATAKDQKERRQQLVQTVVLSVKEQLSKDLAATREKRRLAVAKALEELDAAEQGISSAGTAVKTAEERAACSSGDAARFVGGWATEGARACENLSGAQDRMTKASHDFGIVATKGLDEVVGQLEALGAQQAAVQNRWSTAKEDVKSSATAWAAGNATAWQRLERLSSEQVAMRAEFAALRSDACAHRLAAQTCLEAMKQSAEGHGRALDDVAALQAAQSAEDAAAEASRREALAQLSAGLDGHLSALDGCKSEAHELGEAVGPALARLSALSGQAATDVEQTLARLDSEVQQLGSKASQAQIFAQRISADAAGVIRRGADSVAGAAEAQASASAAFVETQQAQWQDLDAGICASLREIGAAVELSVGKCNDGAMAGLIKIREQRRLATDALGKGGDATEELLRSCSGTLARQLAQVKEGMANTSLTIFDDELTTDSFLEEQRLDSYMQGPEQAHRQIASKSAAPLLRGKAADDSHASLARPQGSRAPLRQLQAQGAGASEDAPHRHACAL
eukprot:TRINITY_DN74379_c0_g1_i1.p1 TRINITY_DN74379_c0_g1~~TRINITY_DN74379_c0_g1_i1.p1  ORF type:complete len:1472 (+),score=438.02 TRINITY_DN74379_c0_g1_i1:100-4515(+)